MPPVGGGQEADVLARRARLLDRPCAVFVEPMEDGVVGAPHGLTRIAGGRRVPEVLQGLFAAGLAVEEVAVRAPSLEQVFIKLTGRELRD